MWRIAINFPIPAITIFTGYPDEAGELERQTQNKNVNVLEFTNRQQGFTGKVAVFFLLGCVSLYIVAEQELSGIYINSDTWTRRPKSPSLQLINQMQSLSSRPWVCGTDLLTYFAGKEYLEPMRPVLYIARDDDDFAHLGPKDQAYINRRACRRWSDRSIPEHGNSPEYDKTTLIVTWVTAVKETR